MIDMVKYAEAVCMGKIYKEGKDESQKPQEEGSNQNRRVRDSHIKEVSPKVS